MSFRIKKRICLLLISILILLGILPVFWFQKEQPLGEYIKKDEVSVLADLLNVCVEQNIGEETGNTEEMSLQKETVSRLKEITKLWDTKEYVTYGQWKQWQEITGEEFGIPMEENISKKYHDKFFITKEDWYHYFIKICETMDPEGKITWEELLVLGDSSNVWDIEGNSIEETAVYTQNGIWERKLGKDLIPLQQKAEYLTYDGAVWGYYNVEEVARISNAWIVENSEETLRYFYKNHYIESLKNDLEFQEREQVADLHFEQGNLKSAETKTEKITGKVMKLSAKEVEIEGSGSYPFAENAQFYRLYDRLENISRNEIRLGYDFTDFVIDEGKVQSALLVKNEKMDNVRILIKNSDFNGYFHEEIVAKANADLELIYGEHRLEIPKGESFTISLDSEYFETSRIYLKPKALTGRTVFENIERNNGGQGYYGIFEIEKREEGLLLVNEVLLEEYLYAVVPSEMPGYYPLEALKAQAISARTYAYNNMISSGLGSYGAHMDDSSTYQVYNNIKENANTTTAVKETRGEILYAGESLAATYYYSTSCGFGTDAAIWNSKGENNLPYLQAKEMTTGTENHTSEELQTEEGFKEFISQKDSSHFESDESWYRWSYEHKNIGKIKEKLIERLEKYPNYVSASTDGEVFGKEPLEEDFQIMDIKVKSRGEGGTIEEILILTDRGQILVKNEYHIRAVLADGESKVMLQSGSSYACGNLLPSSFFVLETIKAGETLTEIKLTGGGFGHGVGMSQNGAKNLANRGYKAEEILEFYYEGCEVKE